MSKVWEVITPNGQHLKKYNIWHDEGERNNYYGVCFTASIENYKELRGWDDKYTFKPIPFSMWEIGENKPIRVGISQ